MNLKNRMKVLSVVIIAMSLIALGACSNQNAVKTTNKPKVTTKVGSVEPKTTPANQAEGDTIKGVINKSIEYAQAENESGYLSLLTSDQRTNKQGIKDLESLFKNFDLKYQIVAIQQPEKISLSTAKVNVTEKILATNVQDGFNFANNESTIQYILIKEKDGWKIFKSNTLNVIYLDKDGNPLNPQPTVPSNGGATKAKSTDTSNSKSSSSSSKSSK